jgi:hypothetical protein
MTYRAGDEVTRLTDPHRGHGLIAGIASTSPDILYVSWPDSTEPEPVHVDELRLARRFERNEVPDLSDETPEMVELQPWFPSGPVATALIVAIAVDVLFIACVPIVKVAFFE